MAPRGILLAGVREGGVGEDTDVTDTLLVSPLDMVGHTDAALLFCVFPFRVVRVIHHVTVLF